nr:hypothetical protein CFP56_69331 [Quercus suber]
MPSPGLRLESASTAMALPNPAFNPPLLSSNKPGQHARSPSRSPLRPVRDFDPLLRDLSPTSTLRLFAAESHQPGFRHDPSFDLAALSASQRSLGTQAAQLCLNLRSWVRELDTWKWPGTFEPPELGRKKVRTSSMHSETTSPAPVSPEAQYTGYELEHWGSMPARLVQRYEQRIAEITEQVDTIEVEELKDYVLSAHQQSDPDATALSSVDPPELVGASDLRRLDDFTAVVTATILVALPHLSKINRLLNVWTIRLTVCRNASAYLGDLKRAHQDLDDGWAAIAVLPASLQSRDSPSFDRDAMNKTRTAMESQIRRLGRRLDRFLDELEGQDDAVPESWIDDFELLESSYGSWVVQAERRVLEEELRRSLSASSAEGIPTMESEVTEKPLLQTLHIPIAEQPEQLKDSSTPGQTRARHVPIVIDYERDGKLFNPELAESVRNDIDSPISTPVSTTESGSPPTLSIKKRSAFLKAEIEQAESLQKQVKSPVRPFEHASNAFTRLFKKDRVGDERQRQVSATSPGTRSLSSGWEPPANERGRTISAPVAAAVAGLNRSATGPQVLPSTSKSISASRRNNEEGGFFKRRRASSAKRRNGPRDYVDLPGGLPAGLMHSVPTSPKSSPGAPNFSPSPAQKSQPQYMSSSLNDPRSGRGALSDGWPPVLPSKVFPQDDGARKRLSTVHARRSTSLPDVLPTDNTISAGDVDDTAAQRFSDPSREHTVLSEPHFNDPVDEALQRDVTSTEREPSPHTAPQVTHQNGFNASEYGRRMPNSDVQSLGSTKDMPLALSSTTLSVPESRAEFFDATPGSVDSALSVEIGNASSVDYFPVQPSPALSRLGSSDDTVQLQPRAQSTSALSPAMLKIVIPGPRRVSADGQQSPLLKRASTTNIETHLRSELKAIDIRPRKSDSALATLSAHDSPSTATIGQTVGYDSLPGGSPDSSPDGLGITKLDSYPSPPTRTASGAASPVSPLDAPSFTNYLSAASSPILGKPTDQSPISSADEAPLNTAMRKRRPQILNSQNGITSWIPEHPPTIKQSAHSSIVPEDSFDRHVSEVLDKLPGTIKFRSRPGAETPISRVAGQRNPVGRPMPRYSQPHSRSNSLGMTIAPAGTSPKKSSAAADVVKLYHLRAEGREEPIKLFVRLVGEDERCMVRVGGGYQDLAEYLRQYAEHHASRTVSGSGLEVFTADPNSHRRVSGPPGSRAQTPVPNTAADSRPASKEGPSPGQLGTPSQSTYPGEDDDHFTSLPESPPFIPAQHQGTPTSTLANSRSTPRTLGSATRRDSRPSTAEAARPSSRTSFHDGSAHASPASIKRGSDLAEHKAKWVEGMLEKARASAEKSKEERFVEINRIGATRRVIFRSPSAQGESTK